jgi:ADP-ribosylglycohydrolase
MEVKYKLYGAILGDLCGQPSEFPVMKGPYTDVKIHNQVSHFTDDTIMTLATAYAILNNISFENSYKEFGIKYDGDYYGKGFKNWLNTPLGARGYSYGNGCLMRLSPIMYVYKGEERIEKALESCSCSHFNIDSLKSVMKLVELYENISGEVLPINKVEKFRRFEVRADKTLEFISLLYKSVNSTSQAIIKAVECGGDTDTNASIAGELCNYKYNDISEEDARYVESKLDPFLLNILKQFNK